MKEAMEFLFSLALKGIKLSVDGDKLSCYAQEGLLTEEIKKGIVQHKPQLIHLLRARAALPASTPLERPEFPLSVAQQGLYVEQKLAPDLTGYNVPICFKTINPIDMPTLRKAWGHVLDQYPILTARIVEKADGLRHCLDERCRSRVREQSIGGADDADVIRRLKEAVNERFDLNSGPLTRIVLYRRGTGEAYLLLTVHHIIFDGTSAVILMKTLLQYYQQLIAGVPVTPATDLLGYQNFVAWEDAMLASPEGEEHARYWQRQLSGTLPVFELPLDQPRSATAPFVAKTLASTLSDRLAYWVHGCSKIHSVPLSVIFLSAFHLLLHKYTGEDDALVTMPVLGRAAGKFENDVGYFVNMVPLRSRSFEGLCFGDFLRSVHTTMLEGLYHSSYPFPLIRNGVESRGADRNAPFEVSYAYQDLLKTIEPPAAGVAAVTEIAQDAVSDLGLEVIEDGASFRLQWKYNQGVYSEAVVLRLSLQYVALLEAIGNSPTAIVGSYSIVPRPEKRRLLVDFNATQADYPRSKCIHELFAERVFRQPDTVAAVMGARSFTYRELYERSHELALYLQAHGVVPDTLVGLCTERSLDMLVGVLGILQAGGAYVPLDPDYPSERLAYMLKDSRAGIVLTQTSLLERLGSFGADTLLIALDQPWPNPAAHAAASTSQTQLRREVGPANLAYVIYTSGSTGKPKAVMVEHRSLVNHNTYARKQYDITERDVQLQFSSMSFDLFIEEVFSILVSGAQLIVEQKENLLTLQRLEETLESRKITVLNVPTSFFHHVAASNLRLAAVEKVIVGGEKLSDARAREFIERNPTVCLHNTYGPTETTVISTAVRVTAELLAKHRFIPIGAPIANTQIHILDPHGNLQPIGVTGEIHIAGDGLARGYLDRPELTEQRFVANPFDAGKRMYRTGDLARWLDDGNIEYLGRIDTQVKIRGFRIELGEIESRLNEHGEILDGVVVVQGTDAHRQLVAFYRAVGSGADRLVTLPAEGLRSHLRHTLPEHMVPAAFVSVPAIPLTPNGKTDRRALERLDVNFESSRQYVAPRSGTEIQVATIFAEILKIRLEKIGVNDNFFELGGHSLLATQVISKVRQTFELDLPMKALFEDGTVVAMAALITAMRDPDPGMLEMEADEFEEVSL